MNNFLLQSNLQHSLSITWGSDTGAARREFQENATTATPPVLTRYFFRAVSSKAAYFLPDIDDISNYFGSGISAKSLQWRQSRCPSRTTPTQITPSCFIHLSFVCSNSIKFYHMFYFLYLFNDFSYVYLHFIIIIIVFFINLIDVFINSAYFSFQSHYLTPVPNLRVFHFYEYIYKSWSIVPSKSWCVCSWNLESKWRWSIQCFIRPSR